MEKNVNRLLEKGSQIVGIDLPYFAKGSFWLTSQQLYLGFLGFLLSLGYARLLDKTIYGQFVFVLSFIPLLESFAYPGLFTSSVIAVAQGREQIIAQTVTRVKKWAILSALPLLGLASYYLLKPQPDAELFKAFAFVFLAAIPYWTFRFYDAYFLGKSRYKNLFFLNSGTETVIALLVFLTLLFSPGTFPLVMVSFGLHTVSRIIIHHWLKNQLNSKQPIRKDFEFANKLTDIQVVNSLGAFADKIIIAKLLGFEAVAIYTFAQLLPEQIKSFLKNFAILSLPKLSQINIKGKKNLFYRKLLMFSGMAIIFTILYILAAPFLYPLAFPAYLDSVLPSQILALSLPTAASLIITAFFESQADTTALRWQTYLAYGLQTLLLFTLTWKFGLLGTSWAITIARIFSLLTGVVLLEKRAKF